MFGKILNTLKRLVGLSKRQATLPAPVAEPAREARALPAAKSLLVPVTEEPTTPPAPEPQQQEKEANLPALRILACELTEPSQPVAVAAPQREEAAPPPERDAPKQEPEPAPLQTAARLVDAAPLKADGPPLLKMDRRYGRRRPVDEQKVKHPTANYYDETGKLAEISYKDLTNENFLRYAWNNNLIFFDDEGHTLLPRLCNTKVPHFYRVPKAKASPRTRTFNGTDAVREVDPSHEDRIENLLKTISMRGPSHLYTIDWRKGSKTNSRNELHAERFVLGDISGYRWTANTKQFSLTLGNVRPDILALPQKPPSEEHPSLIVEVINTHFPSTSTWDAYLQHTIERPLIVLFDFTATLNYFMQVQPGGGKPGSATPTIRAVYYLWKGLLWKNTTPQEEGILPDGFKKLVDLDIRRLEKNAQPPSRTTRCAQSQERTFG